MLKIRKAPKYQTDAGVPGVWYWLDLEGAHELLGRLRAAESLLAGEGRRDPYGRLEEVAPDLEEVAPGAVHSWDDLAPWVEGARKRLADLPRVRLQPLTVGAMQRGEAMRMLLAASKPGKGAVSVGPGGEPGPLVEVEYARSLVRDHVLEVAGVEGVGDDGEETWRITTGRDLLDLIDASDATELAGVVGEIVQALTDVSSLRAGLGEASAWRRAG